MIERAELPVQRNSTLNGRSATAYRSATVCVMVGDVPLNQSGCFTMAVDPIKASNKQMTLICNSR